MNEKIPVAEYDGKGNYSPVIVSVNDSIGVIALTVVATFLSVGIVRLARLNAELGERLAALEPDT
jgi:hypothetical protein